NGGPLPIGTIQGIALGIGQRFLSKPANAVFNRYFKASLDKARNRVITFATEKAVEAGLITSEIAGGIATGGTLFLVDIGRRALNLAARGIKKNWGKVTAIAGAALGFLVGGPIGLLVGGVAGAAVAGLDWQRISKWMRWIAEIILAYFLARFLLFIIYMAIAFIAIPILVAFIVFIINAGAYVVP